MSTIPGNTEGLETDGWKKMRNMFAVVLVVVTAYQMGLSNGRYEKKLNDYAALKAQYGRIEAQYSTLKTQYDTMQSEYAALSAQYEAFQKRGSRPLANAPAR
jgi:flagellar capping protein FliD